MKVNTNTAEYISTMSNPATYVLCLRGLLVLNTHGPTYRKTGVHMVVSPAGLVALWGLCEYIHLDYAEAHHGKELRL